MKPQIWDHNFVQVLSRELILLRAKHALVPDFLVLVLASVISLPIVLVTVEDCWILFLPVLWYTYNMAGGRWVSGYSGNLVILFVTLLLKKPISL